MRSALVGHRRYEIGSFIEKGDKFFCKILVSKVVDFIGGVEALSFLL